MIAALLCATVLGTQMQPRIYPAYVVDCHRGNACKAKIYLGLNTVLEDVNIRLCDVEPYALDGEDALVAQRSMAEMHMLIREAKLMWVVVYQKSNCFGSHCDIKDQFGQLMVYLFIDGTLINKHLVEQELAKMRPHHCQKLVDGRSI